VSISSLHVHAHIRHKVFNLFKCGEKLEKLFFGINKCVLNRTGRNLFYVGRGFYGRVRERESGSGLDGLLAIIAALAVIIFVATNRGNAKVASGRRCSKDGSIFARADALPKRPSLNAW
jgi:hypothetical protein